MNKEIKVFCLEGGVIRCGDLAFVIKKIRPRQHQSMSSLANEYNRGALMLIKAVTIILREGGKEGGKTRKACRWKRCHVRRGGAGTLKVKDMNKDLTSRVMRGTVEREGGKGINQK